MNVLLDMNVVLDLLLIRQPWSGDAARIWDAHREGKIVARLAAFSVPTIFYLVRRQVGIEAAHTAVRECIESLEIVPVQRTTLVLASGLPGRDFEDNLQIASAIEARVDALVTRDPGVGAGCPLPILLPAQVVAQLPQGQ
ncbi:MAG: PIN domain-containing protein [Thermoguttaceae bacterium]